MAYLSGKTKEDPIVVDEDDDREHRSAHRWRPPARLSNPVRGVVDLTLSDDDINIIDPPTSVPSGPHKRKRSDDQNVGVPGSDPSSKVSESDSTPRVMPHMLFATPHFPAGVDSGERIATQDKEEENGSKQETTKGGPSLSYCFINTGLPERTKLSAISKTASPAGCSPLPSIRDKIYPVPQFPLNSASSQLANSLQSTPMIPSRAFPSAPPMFLLPSHLPTYSPSAYTPPKVLPTSHPRTYSPYANTPLASDVVPDVHIANRDGVGGFKSPSGGSGVHYEQTFSHHVKNTSTTESRNTRSSGEKRADSITSEPVSASTSQSPFATISQRKQTAIETASRPGEDQVSRLLPLPNRYLDDYAKALPVQPQSVSQEPTAKQNSDDVVESPHMEDIIYGRKENKSATSESTTKDGLKTSKVATEVPPLSIGSEDRLESPLTNSFVQAVVETSPKPSADAEATKISESSGFEKLRSENSRPKMYEYSDFHGNSYAVPKDITLIDAKYIGTTRSLIELCLKHHLDNLYESHAYLTKYKMRRQRTCHESEFRTQHQRRSGPAPPALPERCVQTVSPFKGLSPIHVPFDKKKAREGMPDFSQEVYIPAKPKDNVSKSGWVSSTLKYKSMAISIPAFKEYVSLKNNILADNESKLRATPYFQDEDDKARIDLRALLPLQYEMIHDENALSDLRTEQCRFYKDAVDSFLWEIQVPWSAVLYWLLAPDREIMRINDSMFRNPLFDKLLLQRSTYRLEKFTRDEEPLRATLFNPDSERWQSFLSQLEEPSASQLRLSALASEAMLDQCGFSIWYLAQQSDVMSRYIARKTKKPIASPQFAFRDVLCRICHQ